MDSVLISFFVLFSILLFFFFLSDALFFHKQSKWRNFLQVRYYRLFLHFSSTENYCLFVVWTYLLGEW